MTTTDDGWLDTPIARYIWHSRYRFVAPEPGGDVTIESTWRRVAAAAASRETGFVGQWSSAFVDLLRGFRFLPGGRILAGAGTNQDTTLFNCFVMGRFDDHPHHVDEALREGALTMQAGGGVGYDFSTLRPRAVSGPDHRPTSAGVVADRGEGVVAHLLKWDAMCADVRSRGARRGAMLASLRCDHPDILEFLDAKRAPGVLTRFNLSVQVFDTLIDAVAQDAAWPLVYPDEGAEGDANGAVVERTWSGREKPVRCRVHREIPARELWRRIMQSAFESGEPGVLFVDRINALNNLGWREHITTTNPCGEVPLPPYGACNLGSINLTRFIREPFTARASIDREALRSITTTAVRFLDNIIDVSAFPLPNQAAQARDCRRIGLGITGLADALIMLGLHYGSQAAREWAADVMRTILHAAYRASIGLAQEKGPFPAFEAAPFVAGQFVKGLPQDLIDGISRFGIRNSHLTAIAPAGTISLLAGNVSSGIEPVFEAEVHRRVLDAEGRTLAFDLEDYAVRAWRRLRGDDAGLPTAYVAARDLTPEQHLLMQAALQPCVDSAISKTINVPSTLPFADFEAIYRRAHQLGLKGCTVFRENPLRGAVLEAGTRVHTAETEGSCCALR